MYMSLVSSRVRANSKGHSEHSNYFDFPVGVCQGCVFSTTLFSLFVTQLANETVTVMHDIQLLPSVIEVFMQGVERKFSARLGRG